MTPDQVQDSHLISVVVPVYNVEKWLSKCIDSILSQTYGDFELILVNDGSKDRSLEICNQYAQIDSRIIVIDKDNEGVSATRNIGIRNAHGKYICFVDSDDFVGPNYLSSLVDTRMKFNSPLVISGMTLYFNGEITEYKVDETLYDKSSFLQLFSLPDTAFLLRGPCCKLFDRHIIQSKRLEFDKSVHFGEDAIFVLQYCLYCNTVAFSSDASYRYYRRDGGLVCSKPIRKDSISELKAFNGIFKLWSDRLSKDVCDIPYFNETLRMIYGRFFGGMTTGYTFIEFLKSHRSIDLNQYHILFRPTTMKGKIHSFMLRHTPYLLETIYYLYRKLL